MLDPRPPRFLTLPIKGGIPLEVLHLALNPWVRPPQGSSFDITVFPHNTNSQVMGLLCSMGRMFPDMRLGTFRYSWHSAMTLYDARLKHNDAILVLPNLTGGAPPEHSFRALGFLQFVIIDTMKSDLVAYFGCPILSGRCWDVCGMRVSQFLASTPPVSHTYLWHPERPIVIRPIDNMLKSLDRGRLPLLGDQRHRAPLGSFLIFIRIPAQKDVMFTISSNTNSDQVTTLFCPNRAHAS